VAPFRTRFPGHPSLNAPGPEQLEAPKKIGMSLDGSKNSIGDLKPEKCLVGGLEHFLFFHRSGIIIPTDYISETTNQMYV
jgi:hypothetical protein